MSKKKKGILIAVAVVLVVAIAACGLYFGLSR